MKQLSNVLQITLSFLLLTAGSRITVLAQAAKPDKKAELKAAIRHLVESQHYAFSAETVLPMGGKTGQLTTGYYDVKITQESVVSYLPFFGTGYSVPEDDSKGGIKFTSKDFNYTESDGKKGGWRIVIKPKDTREVQQMTLNISSDGYTTLQVISSQRQPISFYGSIVDISAQAGR